MRFQPQHLEKIFQRTSGYCHICHKKLNFNNYGNFGQRGAWEVEHSRPQAKGGSHSLNNLYPACISCNRAKGSKDNRSVRAQHGKKRAPLSVNKRRQVKRINAFKGLLLGALAGIFVNVEVALMLASCGVIAGYALNPDWTV